MTDSLQAFLTAMSLVFAAEFGDKTQLVALAFATKYKPGLVLGAITVGALLLHLASVILGHTAGAVIPSSWINIAAGLAFLAFGVWTIRSSNDDEDDDAHRFAKFHPFITVLLTFSIAELGDKTMLTSITVASQQRDLIATWLGSSAGMVLSSAIGIWIGSVMGKRLPHTAIRVVAASVFVITGIATLAHVALAQVSSIH